MTDRQTLTVIIIDGFPRFYCNGFEETRLDVENKLDLDFEFYCIKTGRKEPKDGLTSRREEKKKSWL